MPSRCGHCTTYPTSRSVRAGIMLRRSHTHLLRSRQCLAVAYAGVYGSPDRILVVDDDLGLRELLDERGRGLRRRDLVYLLKARLVQYQWTSMGFQARK